MHRSYLLANFICGIIISVVGQRFVQKIETLAHNLGFNTESSSESDEDEREDRRRRRQQRDMWRKARTSTGDDSGTGHGARSPPAYSQSDFEKVQPQLADSSPAHFGISGILVLDTSLWRRINGLWNKIARLTGCKGCSWVPVRCARTVTSLLQPCAADAHISPISHPCPSHQVPSLTPLLPSTGIPPVTQARLSQ